MRFVSRLIQLAESFLHSSTSNISLPVVVLTALLVGTFDYCLKLHIESCAFDFSLTEL